jgi:hypothetical protein
MEHATETAANPADITLAAVEQAHIAAIQAMHIPGALWDQDFATEAWCRYYDAKARHEAANPTTWTATVCAPGLDSWSMTLTAPNRAAATTEALSRIQGWRDVKVSLYVAPAADQLDSAETAVAA